MVKLSAAIFIPQTILKALQVNASTPVKEYCNTWVAFGIIGVLQGNYYYYYYYCYCNNEISLFPCLLLPYQVGYMDMPIGIFPTS